MNTLAPSIRARRILIAILAFALAAAFVLVASIAPAEAKDAKLYTATPHSQEVGNSAVITFTNVSDTNTQLVGSYSILFPAGFVDLDATVESPDGTSWTVLSSMGDNPVIVSAVSGGDRVGIEAGANEVVVTVTWSDAPSGTFQLTTKGDQQAGGVFKGGNEFKPVTKGDEASDLHPEIITCGATLCGEGFNVDLSCEGECEVFDETPAGGDPVVLLVETGDPFVLVLTTVGGGPPPGQAEVQVEDKENPGTFLPVPNCGLKGSEPVTECVHINRVSGHNIEYTVIWTTDPRFRF